MLVMRRSCNQLDRGLIRSFKAVLLFSVLDSCHHNPYLLMSHETNIEILSVAIVSVGLFRPQFVQALSSLDELKPLLTANLGNNWSVSTCSYSFKAPYGRPTATATINIGYQGHSNESVCYVDFIEESRGGNVNYGLTDLRRGLLSGLPTHVEISVASSGSIVNQTSGWLDLQVVVVYTKVLTNPRLRRSTGGAYPAFCKNQMDTKPHVDTLINEDSYYYYSFTCP